MSDNWYCIKNGRRVGPYSFAQFQQMAACGLLTPSEMVWREGMRCWTIAGAVEQLFAPLGASPHLPLDSQTVPATSPRAAAPRGTAPAQLTPPVAPLPPLDHSSNAGAQMPPSAVAPDQSAFWRTAHAVLVTAGVLAVPFWCLNEFLGKPLLIVAGVFWILFGGWAVLTGSVPLLRGGFSPRLLRHRLMGGLVAGLGVLLVVGGVVESLRTNAKRTRHGPSDVKVKGYGRGQ